MNPSVPPSGHSLDVQPATTTRRRFWAIVIIALLVGAGFSIGIYVLRSPSSSPQPAGLDYFGALARSNQSIANSTGGPWSLVSVLAIVTTEPVWPFPFEGIACQQYPGVSVWNSSRLPVWTGSLSSGLSPFWSLWYLNASQFLLAAFTVNESVHLVGPISPTSFCGQGLAATLANIGLGSGTVVWTAVDSTVASQVAWEAAGKAFVNSYRAVSIYYELDGAQQLGGVSDAPWGWAITYSLCGHLGYAGSTLWPGVRVNVNTSTGPASLVVNEGDQCSLPSYHIFFSTPNSAPAANGITLVTSPFIVNIGGTSNATYADGLVTWMTGLDLANRSTGALEPLASLSCTGSTFNASSCRPSGGGWYAAVAEPNGYWLDVYSNRTGTPGWALPNVPLYSNDSLFLYLPSTLNPGSLTLSVASNTSAVQVVGSAGL